MSDYTIYVDSSQASQNNSYVLHLSVPVTNIRRAEVLSAMLPDFQKSQYLTLDIEELRTPMNLVASELVLTNNIWAPSSNSHSGYFATIPVKTTTNVNSIWNTEFYNAAYRILADYPSRVDKIERLTVNWRYPDTGEVVPPHTLGRNMFILRLETEIVPLSPPLPVLPPPVPRSMDMKLLVFIGAALLGLLIILFSRPKSRDV